MAMIYARSMRTVKVFADELIRFSDDKVLFLCFPFIYGLTKEFVKIKYEKLVKKLRIKDALEFEKVLQTFKEDRKIDTIHGYMITMWLIIIIAMMVI
jgi:hypothetical protein